MIMIARIICVACAAMIAGMFGTSLARADITYNLVAPANTFIDGSITTDGKTGPLTQADIVIRRCAHSWGTLYHRIRTD